MRKQLIICIGWLTMLASSCKEGGNSSPDSSASSLPPEIVALNQKIEQSPKDAALYFQRGQLWQQQQEDSLALLDFKQAATLDSSKAIYFSSVGDLYFRHKDISSSVPWFRNAIKIDPKDPKAHLNFAKVLIYGKDFKEAFKEINTVLRQDVYNPEAYLLKGLIYKELKDTTKAMSSFQTSIQVDPNYGEAMIQLAQIYKAKNDPLAVTYYENAFRTDTTDLFPLYAIGMMYQERNEYEKAKEIYARMLGYKHQSVDALFNTGYILMHQDSFQKARRMFDLATKADIDNAGAYYNRGLCSEILGDTTAALKDYEQALVFEPEYQDAALGIERLQKTK